MDLSADGWAQEPESGPQCRCELGPRFFQPFQVPWRDESLARRQHSCALLHVLESENYTLCQAQAQRLKEEVATVLRGLD